MDNEKVPKKFHDFYCNVCDYSSSRKSQYSRHLTTSKHKDNMDNEMDNEKVQQFICNCGKKYIYMSGLCKHKKKCNSVYKSETKDIECNTIKDVNKVGTQLIFGLIKQNNDFKELLIEQNKTIMQQNNKLIDVCKNIQPMNNIVNNDNKTFNLNVFLNETCKDAMNLMDFINSLKVQLSDLENVGKIGYIEGISNIIIKNLKALDIDKRPVHCSDSKRDVMYVKDENKWEKENCENKRLRKAINCVANKNSKLLPEFKEKYPEYKKSESHLSDQYNKLVIEAFGGKGDNEVEKENKIIKKIAKEVIIMKPL